MEAPLDEKRDNGLAGHDAKAFKGQLTKFYHDKGFGFIGCAETHRTYKADVFVHISSISHEGTGVDVGDAVSFYVGPGRDGRQQAVRVRKLFGTEAVAVVDQQASDGRASEIGGDQTGSPDESIAIQELVARAHEELSCVQGSSMLQSLDQNHGKDEQSSLVALQTTGQPCSVQEEMPVDTSRALGQMCGECHPPASEQICGERDQLQIAPSPFPPEPMEGPAQVPVPTRMEDESLGDVSKETKKLAMESLLARASRWDVAASTVEVADAGFGSNAAASVSAADGRSSACPQPNAVDTEQPQRHRRRYRRRRTRSERKRRRRWAADSAHTSLSARVREVEPDPAKTVEIHSMLPLCGKFLDGKCFAADCELRHAPTSEAEAEQLLAKFNGRMPCRWGSRCQTDGCGYYHRPVHAT